MKEEINFNSDEKTSFEVSELLVSFGSTHMRTVIVYRPQHLEHHPITTGVFFHEFAELLIIGDFDFHMDVPTNPINKHSSDLLDAMGLVKHVKQATHTHGHILDLIITRQSDDFVAHEPLSESFISDYAAVICSLRTPRPVVKLMHAEYRKLKSIDSDLFAEDIRNSFVYINRPDDKEKLTLSLRLNKHALIQSRKIRSGSRTPWFDDEIMQARHNGTKS